MEPLRVLVLEDDPLWSNLVRRVIAAEPALALWDASEDPVVVVLGESWLHDGVADGIVAATHARGAEVIALVEDQDAKTATRIAELGIGRAVERSSSAAQLVDELRAAALGRSR